MEGIFMIHFSQKIYKLINSVKKNWMKSNGINLRMGNLRPPIFSISETFKFFEGKHVLLMPIK